MNSKHALLNLLNLTLLAALTFNASAETRYVDLNSPSPTPPYTNWLTAATNIQNAIDAADAGDLVLVTNGIYATGGRVVYGAMTNRVVVDKALALFSVNGPDVTIIEGYQVPGTTNGNDAIRCVYMTNGVFISGFWLRNGATRTAGDWDKEQNGGGIWFESTNSIASNCVITANAAHNGGGGAYRGRMDGCLIGWNRAVNGGGAFLTVLESCVLATNVARSNVGWGGGCHDCYVTNSMLIGNTADLGGGAYSCYLSGCLIISNSARVGGGAGSRGLVYLRNCKLFANSANAGGGAWRASMTNCVLANNSATGEGGGAYFSAGINCTLVSNYANRGGGCASSKLTNCVSYFNSATSSGDNYFDITFNYCCTTPGLTGIGIITNTPNFVDTNGWSDLRLQSVSPCINAGNNSAVTFTNDLDGLPRISGGTVDIGAYEFQSPASVLSYAWAQQNGLPTDGSADFTDFDGDGANNWHEWRADTSPTNAASALLMRTATNGVTGLVVSWASVATRSYWLERAGDLGAVPPFQTIATNIPGVAGTKTFNDTGATNGGPYFYRVGVQ